MPNSSYHHGNLREQLMQSALIHLRNSNAEQLSLRALARELNVSQTAPYRHFADKNALLAALAQSGFEQLSENMQQAMAQHPNAPADQLRAAGVAYIDFARQHTEQYRLMFGQPLLDITQYPELQTSGDTSFGILRRLVAACLEAGAIEGDNADMIANTAWALVHGLATLIIDRLQYQMSEEMIAAQVDASTRTLFQSAG